MDNGFDDETRDVEWWVICEKSDSDKVDESIIMTIRLSL
jgi:hypothetical protein